MRHLSTMAIAMGAMLSSAVLAAADTESTRHAEAHVHGAGQLNFAVEDRQVHLELDIPGFDILGFESVNSDARREQLNHAVQALKQEDLWGFTAAADCQLKTVSVEAGDQGDKAHKDHHDSDGHHHDDKHGHHGSHHRDKHDHHASHHHEESHGHHHDQETHESVHMDFAATYVYECSQPARLNRISTRLFDRFKHSEMLKLQGFTDSGQIAGTLTRSQPEASF